MTSNKCRCEFYHFLVQVTAIVSLVVYGMVLAHEGIDHVIPMIIGGIIGGIAGIKIKDLSGLLGSK